MNMTQISPFSMEHSPFDAAYFDELMASAESQEIRARFEQGFAELMIGLKSAAVSEVLGEEFPQLTDDENFVKQVIEQLDASSFEEKRFVFLSINPKFKQS